MLGNGFTWCKCSRCGHKLFAYKPDVNNKIDVEIKCSSCKFINSVSVCGPQISTTIKVTNQDINSKGVH